LISQYGYVNDVVGRRTSVGMTGEAFSDLGSSHNKYAYNARSELEQAKRYAGTNLASTANAIDGQAYLYGYDLIGNRSETYIGDMLNGSKHTYTANSLNQYTQKTVPGKARIMGAAASDANVTVNNQTTTRYGQYFQSYLDIANSSSAAYPLINIVGVKKNAGTSGLDVVTTATGHVFVAQTPEQFSYDDDGNLTQDGRWSYTWDAVNRLIGMQTLDSLPASVPRLKLVFTYDYMSRRVSKIVSTFESEIWNQKSQIRFAYDGWNLISELSTANSQLSTNSYVWGLDLSGTLQGAGGIGGLLSSTTQQSSNSTTAYFSYDANGNVGQLVSTNGSFLASYEYDPYGKLIKDVADASVLNNPFRFSSKYLDSETGLNYYGYRYYQPEVGRWVSRDPIGERGSFNLYASFGADPIDRYDVMGLWAWTYTEIDMGGNSRLPVSMPDGSTRYGLTTAVWNFRAGTSPCGGSSLSRADAASDLRTVFWWTPGLFPSPTSTLTTYDHEKSHVSYNKNRWDQLKAYLAQSMPTACICPAKARCMKEFAYLARDYYYFLANKDDYSFDCAQGSISPSYNSCALATTAQNNIADALSQLVAKVQECNQL
jgi:RHS repeat-associated protein